MNEDGTKGAAMYAQTLLDDCGFGCMAARGLQLQAAPTAGVSGLDRFVYLHGASGRRYVFSAVTAERAALYDTCVYAFCAAGAATALPCETVPQAASGGQLYVHLADATDPADVLADLRAAYDAIDNARL